MENNHVFTKIQMDSTQSKKLRPTATNTPRRVANIGQYVVSQCVFSDYWLGLHTSARPLINIDYFWAALLFASLTNRFVGWVFLAAFLGSYI